MVTIIRADAGPAQPKWSSHETLPKGRFFTATHVRWESISGTKREDDWFKCDLWFKDHQGGVTGWSCREYNPLHFSPTALKLEFCDVKLVDVEITIKETK